jgi:hypothetical protein
MNNGGNANNATSIHACFGEFMLRGTQIARGHKAGVSHRTCAVGMTDEQVVEIVNKFLKDNPGRWHESMNILAWTAMKASCRR